LGTVVQHMEALGVVVVLSMGQADVTDELHSLLANVDAICNREEERQVDINLFVLKDHHWVVLHVRYHTNPVDEDLVYMSAPERLPSVQIEFSLRKLVVTD